jgi:hypothetical protein
MEIVSVGTTPAVVHDFGRGCIGYYILFLKNAGAVALNSFKIQGRNSGSGEWVDVVSTAEEFTTIPSSLGSFLRSSDSEVSPTTLAPGDEWNGSVFNTNFLFLRTIASTVSGTTEVSMEVTHVGNL